MTLQDGTSAAKAWWEGRFVLAAMLLLAAVPLLWPPVPPLTDLPGHMARWHIAKDAAASGPLARSYGYSWHLVPNLGMDLLIAFLGRGLSLEIAAKLGVMLIPVLTMSGMLWTACEAHRRLPPSSFMALPLAYAWPFQFGFVNFALAQAMAFWALGLWLRLARHARLRLRAIVFLPIACSIWVAHSAAWGLLGLMAFGADLARQRSLGRPWPVAVGKAAVQCLPLAGPVALMLLARDPAQRLGAADWFDPAKKLLWLLSVLRDRWLWFDLFSLGLILFALYAAARDKRFGFEPCLAYPALLCTAAFLVLPRLLMGGAYVDMRVLPAALCLWLLAVRRPPDARAASLIAMVSIGFFLSRTAGSTISYVQIAAAQQRLIRPVTAIPEGASVLALVYNPCKSPWTDNRADHLPAFAILRKDAFVNEQWDLPGQQLVRVHRPGVGQFAADPSQLVYPAGCPKVGRSFEEALARFPRAAFTHVWTIGAPPLPASVNDLRPILAESGSILYEVANSSAPRRHVR